MCGLRSNIGGKFQIIISAVSHDKPESMKKQKWSWSENRCSLMSISHDMTLLFHY